MVRIVLAVLAASGVMFSLAGVYTQIIARGFIASHVDAALLRSPPDLGMIAAGYFILGLLMTLIYSRFFRPAASPVRRGLIFGFASAVCWLMPYSLVLFGAYRFPYQALPLDFFWALIEQGVGGAIIGLIIGKAPAGVART